MNESLLYGLAAGIALYVLIRYFMRRKIAKTAPVDAEIRDILTKDEHRVKGRFE